ncbi:hypothetical protein PISMIDRAFT_671777 [Pisolithus microcarpus 441]|uniref:Uncharacterized protein n=1 Tax=Pisolithus microcarpus 441 TaxID=765257 RepID=A0A0D0ACI5_9AGAM|nr:hypothetical protein PISMIDRAFT_671777 [Pisolithus microcarpus 441]
MAVVGALAVGTDESRTHSSAYDFPGLNIPCGHEHKFYNYSKGNTRIHQTRRYTYNGRGGKTKRTC